MQITRTSAAHALQPLHLEEDAQEILAMSHSTFKNILAVHAPHMWLSQALAIGCMRGMSCSCPTDHRDVCVQGILLGAGA